MENFKQKFNAILIENLRVDEEHLKHDAKFIDLGANSLDIIELMIDFEKIFKLSIPDEDIEKIITIGDAEEYLKQRLGINT